MKTIFYTIISILFCGLSLSQKLNIGVDCGYNFSLASQNLTSNTNIGIIQTSNAVVKGSFGKGINIGAYATYKTTENIFLELGISYLQGSQFKGGYTKDTDFVQKIAVSGTMLRLSPAVRVAIGEGKMKPYVKVGMLVRLAGNIKTVNTFEDMRNGTTTTSEWKYSHGLSLGATSGIGLMCHVNKKTSVFGEVFFNVQSWAPKNSDITGYSVNGVDMISTLNTSQKHTHYSDEYTETNGNFSGWEPRKQLKQYHPFSSFGLKAGIQYTLGKQN